MQEKPMQSKRLYGLDLLKIFSILLITAIHFIWYPKVFNIPDITVTNRLFLSFIDALSTSAINCFFLITGYFLCEKKTFVKNAISLWGKTYFTSLVAIVLGSIFFGLPSLYNLTMSLFPLLSGRYWFIITYMLLLALAPMLNATMQRLNKASHLRICVFGCFLLCFLFIANPKIDSALYIGSDWGIVGACFLYFCAGYIRKYNLHMPKSCTLFISLTITCLLTAMRFFDFQMPYVNINISNSNYAILPFILSLSFFLFFLDVKVRKCFHKFITTASSCSFFVYILQEHHLIRTGFWKCMDVPQHLSSNTLIFHFFFALFVLWPVAWLLDTVYQKFIHKHVLHAFNKLQTLLSNKLKRNHNA